MVRDATSDCARVSTRNAQATAIVDKESASAKLVSVVMIVANQLARRLWLIWNAQDMATVKVKGRARVFVYVDLHIHLHSKALLYTPGKIAVGGNALWPIAPAMANAPKVCVIANMSGRAWAATTRTTFARITWAAIIHMEFATTVVVGASQDNPLDQTVRRCAK